MILFINTCFFFLHLPIGLKHQSVLVLQGINQKTLVPRAVTNLQRHDISSWFSLRWMARHLLIVMVRNFDSNFNTRCCIIWPETLKFCWVLHGEKTVARVLPEISCLLAPWGSPHLVPPLTQGTPHLVPPLTQSSPHLVSTLTQGSPHLVRALGTLDTSRVPLSTNEDKLCSLHGILVEEMATLKESLTSHVNTKVAT